jgi:hypothetical protein
MPSSWAIGCILIAALSALVAGDADALSSQLPSSTDATTADVTTDSAPVNTTVECLPGFERHVTTGACFQPPTCFLPMILSDERDTCICARMRILMHLKYNVTPPHLVSCEFVGPASEPTHKDYWGGFRVINGMWFAIPSALCISVSSMSGVISR